MSSVNMSHLNQPTKDQRHAQYKAGIAGLAAIAVSGFIGSLLGGFGPISRRSGAFDTQRLSKSLSDAQADSIIQRCNASTRDGKRRRVGHQPHGSRLEHYRAMRWAECSVNRFDNLGMRNLEFKGVRV